jgi:hypothetical protein
MKWSVASVALRDAYTDFILSRRAMKSFTIPSWRVGMDALHLQNLCGWASLDMVQHYAQTVDEDLLQMHNQHSSVDNL